MVLGFESGFGAWLPPLHRGLDYSLLLPATLNTLEQVPLRTVVESFAMSFAKKAGNMLILLCACMVVPMSCALLVNGISSTTVATLELLVFLYTSLL